METTARDAYLEAQVMTATPQKLRLMLIEGAIQFGRQTVQHWSEERYEEGMESLIRCRRIITELLTSIRADETKLTRTLSQIYLFLFRTLTEAQAKRELEKVREVLRVLEEERVTWQQLCQQMPEAPAELYEQSPVEITVSDPPPDAPISGLSLDA